MLFIKSDRLLKSISAWGQAALLLAALGCASARAEAPVAADVVIYKASPGGIIAAVAAADSGSTVLLVEPTPYVGGIIAQGALCASDIGKGSTIGGWSREFFRLAAEHYRTTYGENSPQYRDSFIGDFPGGNLEPKIAEMLFEKLLKDRPSIRVVRNAELASVNRDATRIQSIVCTVNGKPETYSGKIFMDASYTGDLMALAKIPFHLGSESRDEFGESLARSQAGPQIQCFNYRVTLARSPNEIVPIEKPENYDPKNYEEITDRILRNPPPKLKTIFQAYWKLPNNKQDTNVADMAGSNWDYPTADAATRLEIEKAHRLRSLGFLYFLQNDPSIPESVRLEAQKWGLPKDEFADNNHFPREIYVREGRRLRGAYVMKQSDLQVDRRKPDSIGLGSYTMDSHATELYKSKDGKTHHGGSLWEPINPYEIPYRALVPKEEDCTNLLVPVCLSATHMGWTSLRMEPVFMIAGEAAGHAASLAISGKTSVQKIPVSVLQQKLRDNKGLLTLPPEAIADFDWEPKQPKAGEPVRFQARNVEGASPAAAWNWSFTGGREVDSTEASPEYRFALEKTTVVTLVVKDAQGRQSQPVSKIITVGAAPKGDAQIDSEDTDGIKKTFTEKSIAQTPFYGQCFYHDSNTMKGSSSTQYTFPAVMPGTYSVYISTTGGGRSADAKVRVESKTGEEVRTINQNTGDPLFGLILIGDYEFAADKPPRITIFNKDSHGYVIYDIARLVLRKPAAESQK